MDSLQKKLSDLGLEIVIGLETHVRLNTASKLFCDCPNQEAEEPNTNICSICTGQMGVLPSVNKEAVKKAIKFGLAIDSHINEVISWDRKHYEYPDLPKNFQLTQFLKPVLVGGTVNCFRNDGSLFSVELEQVHIEEDAAKLVHEPKQSLVDFNKGGVPLIEIVTKPCMQNIEDASVYAQYVQRIVQNLEISNANLEKGEFKSDASVSLRKKGTQDLNPRTEIKNLNSFKFLVEALEEEVSKQLAYFEENKTFRPDQTTVLWNDELKQTKTMRKKEFAADYRFSVEPDIPNVSIANAIKSISINKELLPYNIETIIINGGIRPQDAKFFTSDTVRSEIFLAINKQVNDVSFVAKTLTNTLKPEEYYLVGNANSLAEIFNLYKSDKISPDLLQTSISKLLKDPKFNYNEFFEANSISEETLQNAVDKVLLENEAIATDIKNGNVNKAGILVGKVIQVIGKGASGKVIRECIINSISPQENNTTTTETAKTKEAQQVLEEQHPLYNHPIVVKENYASHKIDTITEELISQEVSVAGWVNSVRDHGDLVFVDLRDTSYEVIQVRLSRENLKDLDLWAKLKPESVIRVEGTIIKRGEEDINQGIKTGKLELNAAVVELLNHAKTLPFEIKKAAKANENIRFTYKYLDHRSKENRQAIINRHRVIKLIRDRLDDNNFIEVETPVLTAGTEEGAREFIVPSRKFAGKFYTLPQAPQQFKQMLMVGGFDRYFQIARCFRDEDSRGDRQPEFTQLDIEMSFVSMQEVMDLNADLLLSVIDKVYGKKWKVFPFKVLTYKESMDKYGCDRPDLRYGLELQDITEVVKETSFQVFKKPIEQGGIVKCIKVEGSLSPKRLSKGQIERLTAIAQENGLGGLAYIIVNENELQSPIIKYLGEDIAQKIIDISQAKVGDIVFFSAADYNTANKVLDIIRQELAKMLNLVKANELHPAWVIDFPQFELTDEGNWTFSHNPFSMPKFEDLDKHMKGEDIGSILAQQYDLVLNGYEIGGGSIRAHKASILEATYKNMGFNKAEMMKSVGHMAEAFHFGAPPHGGIAWGVDRLMMILEKKNSIREVMAFPKTGTGEDLLFGSPSTLPDKKINEANIQQFKKDI